MKKLLLFTVLAIAILSIASICFAEAVSLSTQKLADRLSTTQEINLEVSDKNIEGTTILDQGTIDALKDYLIKLEDKKEIKPQLISSDVFEKLHEAGIAALLESKSGDTETTGDSEADASTSDGKRVIFDKDKIVSLLSSGDKSILLPSFDKLKPAGKRSGEKLDSELVEAIAESIGTLIIPKASGEKVSGDKKEEIKEEVKEIIEKINWSEASAWALDELNKANEKGLIPSVFSKANLKSNITRKEFAHISVKLYELLAGKKADKPEKNPFTDTDDEEVLKAYNVGITEGTDKEKGLFSPDKEITREQMATMITRALEKAGIDVTVDLTKVKEFTDDNEMHNWSRGPIYFMAEKEIIKGIDSKAYRYGVKNNASREQAVVISVRSADEFKK